MIKDTKKRVIITLDEDIAFKLEHESDRSERTKSQIVEQALDIYLHQFCGWMRKDQKLR